MIWKTWKNEWTIIRAGLGNKMGYYIKQNGSRE